MSPEEENGVEGRAWLLLAHQLPAKPAYLRVKIWRRLQALGAVALKNGLYALPMREQAREDLEWLRREIVDGGGEAVVFEARFVSGLSDREVQDLFRAAREADYDGLAQELRSLRHALPHDTQDGDADIETRIKRLRHRRDQVAAIDFFGANGRETVDGLLAELDRERPDLRERRREGAAMPSQATWVTRENVHVDRIASAWLIRRFIDPQARFKFVPAQGYRPKPGEVRFDMFEAEFTHEGDRCTFEVLVSRSSLEDPALSAIGEIVHDIDLKDGKFGRAEAAGVRSLIAGICFAGADDSERVARGAAIFEDLYEFFRKARRTKDPR
ncbi:MAG TPA: chromate resistance protein ChrB domain-containing protein [Microvirga sp.]|nr:chromate resistance protein ChrB domain-containing protein [Microvirga sp.]